MVHNYKIFHNNLIITDSIEITNFLKDLKLQSMQQTIEFIEECGFGIHENVNMINKNDNNMQEEIQVQDNINDINLTTGL